MSNNSRWYVVHTYSGYEKKVASNILKLVENRKMQDEIFEVRIPVEVATTTTTKKIVTSRVDKKGKVQVKESFTLPGINHGREFVGESLAQSDKKISDKVTIIEKDISESGIGTITVSLEDGSVLKLEVTRVEVDEDTGEEITTIRYEKGTERLVFPGYVMVKIATFLDDNDMPRISDEAWLVVRGTRGATGFVGPEGKPVPLTEEEVYNLGVEKRVVEVKYKVGDTVMILADILAGNTGTVESIDLEKKIVKVVSYAFFGKETSVELGLDQVELVSD